MTHSSLKFYELIRQQTLPADMERTTPLCMTQFGRLFATTRIPNAGRDKLLTYNDSKHVIVLRGGFFWELQVIDGRGGIMSREQLASALQSIVDEHESFRIEIERNPEQEELRVGLLTTEHRETWARARAHLLSANHANITAIDTALFILCLDAESDGSFEVGLGTGGDPSIGLSMADVSRTMLHGYRGRNRWFDKLQLIVMANGKAGINMEHSPYDGHTVLNYATRVHEDITKQSALPEAQPLAATVSRTPKRLTWSLDVTSRAAIQNAQHEFDAFIMRTESSVLEVRLLFMSHETHSLTRSFARSCAVDQVWQELDRGTEPEPRCLCANGLPTGVLSLDQAARLDLRVMPNQAFLPWCVCQ